VAQQADDRCVVDVAIGQRTGGIPRAGVEDGERRGWVEANGHPGARCRHATAALVACLEHEARVGRVLVPPAAIEDQPHLVSLQNGHQAGHMVLVRVCQDHDVDAPMPPGQALPQSS
jgi:hypothetical protein